MLDGNGRFMKDPAQAANATIFVSRKERGFGEAYAQNRTGEWEYVGYRPDGTFQTTPPNSLACAACHRNQIGPENDWTARVSDLIPEEQRHRRLAHRDHARI
jgi:hypothetical protein